MVISYVVKVIMGRASTRFSTLELFSSSEPPVAICQDLGEFSVGFLLLKVYSKRDTRITTGLESATEN